MPKNPDIAVLQTEVKGLKESVNKIMDNHLPHIQQKLESIERRHAYYAGGVVVILTLVQYFLK